MYDVAAEVKDQTNPGLLVANTTYQDGNVVLALSNPEFDAETNTLSVDYSDSDGNLPWFKSAQICEIDTDLCFYNPEEGWVLESCLYRFSLGFSSEDLPSSLD